MPIFTITFTSESSTHQLPLNLSREFIIRRANIFASTLDGLSEAVDIRAVYILLRLESEQIKFEAQHQTLRFPFNNYQFLAAIPNFSIEMNERFVIPVSCVQAHISIVPEVMGPIEKIELIMEDD